MPYVFCNPTKCHKIPTYILSLHKAQTSSLIDNKLHQAPILSV